MGNIFCTAEFFIEIHILQEVCYQNPGAYKNETKGN